MCTVALATLAVAAASAAVSYSQAQDLAEAQVHNTEVGYQNAANQAAAVEQEQNQIATEQMTARAIAARKEVATMRAAGAETGLTGNSYDKAIQESMFNAGQDLASIESNKARQTSQNAMNLRGIRAGADSSIANARANSGSLLGTGLQIAGAGLSAYTSYKKTLPSSASPKTVVKSTVP